MRKMKIKKITFFQLWLPIMVGAFIGQGTSFVDAVVSANTRWCFFLLLALLMIVKKTLLQSVRGYMLPLLLSYFVWCIATTFWSEVPELSFMKSIMFAAVIITLISAGGEWTRQSTIGSAFNWLIVLCGITLISGVLGEYSRGDTDVSAAFALYQGLSGNPNNFAFMCVMSLLFFVFQTYRHWSEPKLRYFYGALTTLLIYYVFEGVSRSAYMAFGCLGLGFLMSLPLRKRIQMVVGGLLVLIVALLLASSVLINVISTHLYKSASHTDLLESRQSVWAVSYQHAVEGGWFGGGFGVNIGETQFVFRGLDTQGYGREKGNSQLAIVEETGLVGLIFYSLILFTFFKKALHWHRRLQGAEKMVMGLALGALLGLIMESIAEGWWDTPAAPETVYFWTLFGLVLGMIEKAKRKQRELTPVETPVRPMLADTRG